MTDDEEVVFQGSFLDNHLKGVGLDDYFTASRDNKQVEIVADGSLKACRSKESGETQSWRWRWLIKRYKWFTDYCTISKIDVNEMIWNMTNVVLTSDILDADDSHFLHSVDPQCFNRPARCQNTMDITIVNVVATCGLISAFSFQLILASSDISVALHVALLVIIMLLGLVTVSLLTLEFYLLTICDHWQHHVTRVQELLNTVGICFNIFGRSIKLIKEQELIANGFLSNEDQFETSGVRDIRGCPALRVTMANEGTSFLIGLRKATCQLVQRVPVNAYIDDSSHYIAFVELESLSISEQPSHLPKSLAQLKMLLQLIRSQTSEYFRRLILSFTKSTISSLPKLKRTSEQLKSSLTSLQQLSSHWKLTNNEALELQKRLLIDCHTAVISKMLKTHDDQTSRQTSLLYAANNMEVHLQAALVRVRELVKHIESDEYNSSPSAVEAIGEWLESDVSACKSSCCLLLSKLHSLLHPELEDTNSTDNSNAADSEEGQDDVHVACGKNVKDKLLDSDEDEDEVYEAYVPPEDSDDKQSSFRSSKLDQQLSEIPYDTQDPLKMIIELKSVLAAKAASKLKSEPVKDPVEPLGHVVRNADYSMRYSESSNGKIDSEASRNHVRFGIDMSSLSVAIAAVRKRNTAKMDELEASGEADSDTDFKSTVN
ncbi:uncharacterized protein LOC134197022 isoform X2 [Corticium candelabrum]|uniref:uncharacterized protein LOC134197022 isoform X2 n=1 Tax=Corticium candelabrum TaxID=121492 RepID=UPI002E26764C|nr:uncharacterized protein LOC134197022 isoform X2 [Corticium candelabrum]